MTLSIGIYVFDQVEALDFAGPYEVFTTAARMHARQAPASPASRMRTRRLARVVGSSGMAIAPREVRDVRQSLSEKLTMRR